jgi:hypothetical protein
MGSTLTRSFTAVVLYCVGIVGRSVDVRRGHVYHVGPPSLYRSLMKCPPSYLSSIFFPCSFEV